MPHIKRSSKNWVIPTEDGFLVAREATVLRRIRGHQALNDLLNAIFAVLEENETAPLEEICSRVTTQYGYGLALVREAIQRFTQIGVLELVAEDEINQHCASLPQTPLQPYFEWFVTDPTLPGLRLHDATIAVVGTGDVAQDVASALRACGVGSVSTLSPPNDSAVSNGDSKGQSHLLLDHLTPSNPDLVIGCAENTIERLRFFPLLGRWSVEQGIPWLAGAWEGESLIIGPLFIPGETACYHCLEMREESHLPYRDEFQFVKQHVRLGAAAHVQKAPLPLFWQKILSNFLVAEAVHLMSHLFFPATYQTVLLFETRTWRLEHHVVLRVPFCPICSPFVERPFQKIWDI
nr:TOMM precursor leader peptide-binding protein [Ardenticatena sp.]